MGLDMYLLKTKKTNHSVKQLNELDRIAKPDEPRVAEFELKKLEYVDYHSIFEEVAYWRKFNALHSWFVTNVQIGIDDCGTYEVFEDHIRDLIETLENTLAYKDPSDMMPVSGFFFGSTIVDEYYWERIQDALDKLDYIADTFDWEKERLFYVSSW